MLRNVVFFFILSMVFISNSYGADKYVEKACKKVFYTNTHGLSQERDRDLDFIHIDEFCCCKDKILALFKKRTKEENKRVNPAVDTMLKTLAEYEKTIRYTVKEVENLKQINAMYSFPQTVMVFPKNTDETNSTSGGDGCVPLDFTKQEDRDRYLAVMDSMENRGLGAGAYTLRNGTGGQAFGRYQFIASTASDYCTKTTPSLECCTKWKSTPQCQDEMFMQMTRDNTRHLMRRGIPLNTCTLYLAHQQGAGGVYWIFGGKNPYGNIGSLQQAVSQNAPQAWSVAVAQGLDITDENVLRKIYLDFWNKRLSGDILNSGGTEYSPEDFNIQIQPFIKYAEKQKSLWREGILYELQKITHTMDREEK